MDRSRLAGQEVNLTGEMSNAFRPNAFMTLTEMEREEPPVV